jgi:hypothetical protein
LFPVQGFNPNSEAGICRQKWDRHLACQLAPNPAGWKPAPLARRELKIETRRRDASAPSNCRTILQNRDN